MSGITLHSRPALKSQDEGADDWMKFRLEIEHSEITVNSTVDEFDRSVYLDAIHMRASDIAITTVNLIAFATGMRVTTILDTFTGVVGGLMPPVSRRATF